MVVVSNLVVMYCICIAFVADIFIVFRKSQRRTTDGDWWLMNSTSSWSGILNWTESWSVQRWVKTCLPTRPLRTVNWPELWWTLKPLWLNYVCLLQVVTYNHFHSCSFPLCGSWRSRAASHQTTSRQPSILRRWSCCVEQPAIRHSNCINIINF